MIRKFYKNEVFKSDRFEEHPASDLITPCFVLFYRDYLRGRPMNPNDHKVFVCESRYTESIKKIDKIKNWNHGLPEAIKENEPELELFDSPLLQLDKIPSPFAEEVVRVPADVPVGKVKVKTTTSMSNVREILVSLTKY